MAHQYSATPTHPHPSDTSTRYQHGYNTVKTSQASLKTPLRIPRPKPKARKHHLKLLGPVENHATTSTSDINSSFLRLTPEIRRLIFSYALTSPTSSLTYNATSMRFDLSHIGTGLLTSCHEIVLEAQYLHPKLNTLVFDIDGHDNISATDLSIVFGNLQKVGEAFGWIINMKIRHKDGVEQHRRLCDRDKKSYSS